MKFTDGKGGSIAKMAPPDKGQRVAFDEHRDAPRGFGLRITAAGGKAFILVYYVEGRQRRKTIGAWPDWSLEAAREQARRLRQEIDQGSDPLEADRERKAAPTVAEAVETHLARHVAGMKSEKAIRRYFERDVLPTLGTLKVRDVRRRDVLEIIEEKAASTPTAARNLLAYIKVFFDDAVDRELIDASPAAGIKPRNIKVAGRRGAIRPTRRERVLSDGEIATFWHAVETCGMHRLSALALKLILVTGQRPGEVSGLHAREIEGDTWTIPAARRGKTESAHAVPLTPLALEIIEQASAEAERLSHRRKAAPSGYLFEARPGAPVTTSGLGRAVSRYATTLGNEDAEGWGRWTPHDLRRTARTGLSAAGIGQEVAERVIGHGGAGIVAVYNRHAYNEEKRGALQAWENRLRGIVEGQPAAPGNVVAFREARQ